MLEKLWRIFSGRWKEHSTQFYMSHSMAAVVLGAFDICTDRKRTAEVWECIRDMWKPDSGEVEELRSDLQRTTGVDCI